MAKVSVIVPVYVNEQSLEALFLEITTVEERLAMAGHSLELIFIDDGSTDDSLRKLLDIKRRRPATRIIKLTRNFGAMSASKIGFQHVSGDCAIALAADLQDPPQLITAMVEKWQKGAKFVVCVRTRRADPLTSRV